MPYITGEKQTWQDTFNTIYYLGPFHVPGITHGRGATLELVAGFVVLSQQPRSAKWLATLAGLPKRALHGLRELYLIYVTAALLYLPDRFWQRVATCL